MGDITTESVVTAILSAAFVLAMVVLGILLAGCPLHNPVPVDPNYPAKSHDAGHDG